MFIIPTIIIPVSPSLIEKFNPEEMKLFFPLLMLLSLYVTSAYWLLTANSACNKMEVFVKLALANFLLYPLMGLIESLFWLQSLNVIDSAEFIRVFFRFVITYTAFSAYLAIICKKHAGVSA